MRSENRNMDPTTAQRLLIESLFKPGNSRAVEIRPGFRDYQIVFMELTCRWHCWSGHRPQFGREVSCGLLPRSLWEVFCSADRCAKLHAPL